MFLETILVIFIGILFGILTGLVPGIHINLIASILLVNFSLFSSYFPISYIIIFIISMGTTHTFVDFIPSVLFGVPSSDTALSVLPAHKLVLGGLAYKAIFLSSIGSLFGMVYAIITFPFFFFTLEISYNFVKPYIPYLLIFTLSSLILLERNLEKIFYAIVIVSFAGGLGLLILNSNLTDNPLLLLFSGMFGISCIFQSLKDENSIFPKQTFETDFKFSFEFFKTISIGGICSSICSISPGIGNAQAGTLASLFFKKLDSQIFIVVLSAINTINFILSFLTLYLIDRARNGAVFVIAQITDEISFKELIIYFLIIIVVSILAFFITLKIGKSCIKIISKLNFKLINYSLLIFIILLIFFLTNLYGLLILFCATFLGILCVELNVRRVHLMAILLIPVILNLI